MGSLLDDRRNPFDPRFPPDFRWRRAVELVDLGRRARRPYDDAPTCRARRYVAALGRCDTAQGRARLAATDPDLDAARRLQAGPAWPRALLEAQILAGRDDTAAAAACGVSAGTAKLYHDLFFDVRPWLDVRLFVLQRLLPSPPFAATDGPELLRRLAYEGGPAVVEPALRYFAGAWTIPQDLAAVDPAALRELEQILWVHAAVQAHTLPASKRPASKRRRAEALAGLLDEFRALVDGREAEAVRAPEGASAADAEAAAPQPTAVELLEVLVGRRPLAA